MRTDARHDIPGLPMRLVLAWGAVLDQYGY